MSEQFNSFVLPENDRDQSKNRLAPQELGLLVDEAEWKLFLDTIEGKKKKFVTVNRLMNSLVDSRDPTTKIGGALGLYYGCLRAGHLVVGTVAGRNPRSAQKEYQALAETAFLEAAPEEVSNKVLALIKEAPDVENLELDADELHRYTTVLDTIGQDRAHLLLWESLTCQTYQETSAYDLERMFEYMIVQKPEVETTEWRTVASWAQWVAETQIQAWSYLLGETEVIESQDQHEIEALFENHPYLSVINTKKAFTGMSGDSKRKLLKDSYELTQVFLFGSTSERVNISPYSIGEIQANPSALPLSVRKMRGQFSTEIKRLLVSPLELIAQEQYQQKHNIDED